MTVTGALMHTVMFAFGIVPLMLMNPARADGEVSGRCHTCSACRGDLEVMVWKYM